MVMDPIYSEVVESLAERLVQSVGAVTAIPGLEVYEVITRRDMRRFIRLPLELYGADPNFVFEPLFLQKEFFSKKNPFFQHSSARYFLAEFNGVIVGRIASIINTVHNHTYNESCGFFGFFECVRNYEVARLLLDEVMEVHRNAGFTRVIGPTNFTTNDSAGLLISGFDTPPVVMMPYNKPYYADFLTKYGFEKEIDLSSYFMTDAILSSGRFISLTEQLKIRLEVKGITFRCIDYTKLEDELKAACPIYNESNRNNWGFIPLTETEFSYTGTLFSKFVPHDLIILASRGPEIVGFGVVLPDLNQVFSKIRSGKLFPFGYINYLRYRKRITGSRILILGVEQSLRNSGIDVILYKTIQENLAKHGIRSGEACYVMENNKSMNSILRKLGGEKVKDYRIFKMDL